jgi:hypothetical protein
MPSPCLPDPAQAREQVTVWISPTYPEGGDRFGVATPDMGRPPLGG